MAAMQSRLKLKPGQKGTRKMVDQYGAQLFCVRYRYDEPSRKRIKTVELIVDEKPWQPKPRKTRPEEIVRLRIGYKEFALQSRIKEAGGKWNPADRVWELRFDLVRKLDLEARIEAGKASDSRNQKASDSR
jgi:hypothetical protein